MNLTFHYHRNSNLVIEQPEYQKEYLEIENSLKEITDFDLIEEFNRRKGERENIKSLSEPINALFKEKLVNLGWKPESGIFKEPPYSNQNMKRWRLDFAKNTISIEVAFNHGEATAHNIMKPVLASELNHVEKEIQTKMGVIITATDELKKACGFDSTVGTFEKFIEYFKPYNSLIPTPIVLIGIEKTETFYIEPVLRNGRRVESVIKYY